MPGGGGGGLGRALNFCTTTRGPANFCPKTGHQKRFFSTKQQDKSSERGQVV